MSIPSPVVLRIRVSARESAMLEAAIEQARTSLSDFVSLSDAQIERGYWPEPSHFCQ